MKACNLTRGTHSDPSCLKYDYFNFSKEINRVTLGVTIGCSHFHINLPLLSENDHQFTGKFSTS